MRPTEWLTNAGLSRMRIKSLARSRRTVLRDGVDVDDDRTRARDVARAYFTAAREMRILRGHRHARGARVERGALRSFLSSDLPHRT